MPETVAEDSPPEPYPQDPNSLAGIDFQLHVTEYDAAGRPYRAIDNLGRINETQYDAAGRAIRTIQNYDDGEVDETDTDRDVTVEYEYDSAGRLVTLVVWNAKGFGSGVEAQATKYLYTSPINASWHVARRPKSTGHRRLKIDIFEEPKIRNVAFLAAVPPKGAYDAESTQDVQSSVYLSLLCGGWARRSTTC